MNRKLLTSLCVFALMMLMGFSASVNAQTYVGSATCIGCHQFTTPNVVNEYLKSGHPYKLNEVNGAPPVYPANTSIGVPDTPPHTTWDDFSYVIGGYGWKARFVKKDGRVYTTGDSAQYNLETQGWVAYNKGTETKYNYACFKCHTTGPSADGSWNGVPGDALGTFSEAGIRCEGCHGPGSDHTGNPSGVKLPNQGDALTITRCGDCHQRGGITNAIPAKGGFIEHHEQINEMRASKHGDSKDSDLTCGVCHNVHVPLRYPAAAGEGQNAIKIKCQVCHADKQLLVNGNPKSIDCIDCHMPQAGKSAVGLTTGNGFRGDVRTHIWNIDTRAVGRDSMFTSDKLKVKLDDNGLAHVTLDFVCLKCHTTQDVAWAASYADSIHVKGITVGIEESKPVVSTFALEQNYPNPFNPTTTIAFNVPQAAQVKLSIYAITGQLVKTLIDNRMPAGNHTVTLNAENLASGVYIYTMNADGFVSSKKMMLIR